jgi:hypothetical protein
VRTGPAKSADSLEIAQLLWISQDRDRNDALLIHINASCSAGSTELGGLSALIDFLARLANWRQERERQVVGVLALGATTEHSIGDADQAADRFAERLFQISYVWTGMV